MWLFLLFVSSVKTEPASCPDGYFSVKSESNCFQISNSMENFENAMSNCDKIGSQLSFTNASFDSIEIDRRLKSDKTIKGFWVGTKANLTFNNSRSGANNEDSSASRANPISARVEADHQNDHEFEDAFKGIGKEELDSFYGKAEIQVKKSITELLSHGKLQDPSARKHAEFQTGFLDEERNMINKIAQTGMESLKLLEHQKEGELLRKFRNDKNKQKEIKEEFSLKNFRMTDISNTSFQRVCSEPVNCNPQAKYRTLDGSCNNLMQPKFGWIRTPYQRILQNAYSDGWSALRKNHQKKDLPNARKISLDVVTKEETFSKMFSVLLMSFGQFVDHDLTQSPSQTFDDGGFINCCQTNKDTSNRWTSNQCASIEIKDDSVFKKPCMTLTRSQAALRLDCRPGPTEQMNQITHWLDLSQVYGNGNKKARNLRMMEGGKLATSEDGMLPLKNNSKKCGTSPCFLTGDSRASETPYLCVLHTVFLRAHNGLAEKMAKLNNHWTDETIYQETKRLMTAIYQHIVYNEFIPALLGRKLARAYWLLPEPSEYYSGYDPGVDPRITNEFGAAIFRFGHALVPSKLMTYSLKGQEKLSETDLRKHYFDNDMIFEPGNIEKMMKAMIIQPSGLPDHFVTEQLTDFLFWEGEGSGLDLLAINIQRGRDHGLQGYVRYKEICEGESIKNFQDLKGMLSDEPFQRLQKAYEDVDDIDLYIGMLMEFDPEVAETGVDAAFVGPTIACILGDQFLRLKMGDRFYYENGGQPGSFTKGQLKVIKAVTMSSLFCDAANGKDMDVQGEAFRQPDKHRNPMVPCNKIPRIDLNPWKDLRDKPFRDIDVKEEEAFWNKWTPTHFKSSNNRGKPKAINVKNNSN